MAHRIVCRSIRDTMYWTHCLQWCWTSCHQQRRGWTRLPGGQPRSALGSRVRRRAGRGRSARAVLARIVSPLSRYFFNTLYILVPTVSGTLITASLAAFGFSRLQWPGRDWVFGILLSALMLPCSPSATISKASRSPASRPEGEGCPGDRSGCGRYQSSTSRPGTRENSSQLRVISVTEPARAMEAIIKSFAPIGRPSRRNSVRITP